MAASLEAAIDATDQGATLEIEDLLAVRDAGSELTAIREWLNSEDSTKQKIIRELLAAVLSEYTLAGALCEPLPTAFEQHPEEGVRLADAAFPELAIARRQELKARASLESAKRSVLKSGMLALADDSGFFELEGRSVVAIKAGASAGAGLVQGASRTGQTKYVEPHAVTAPTNELRSATSRTRAEENAALRLLSESVRANSEALRSCLEAAAQLDALNARSSLGKRLRGVIPEMMPSTGAFEARQLRHAVLELQYEDEAVGNDISLGLEAKRCLVISGANAGGKTVLMKSVGVAAMLVRMGVPVPCSAGGARLDCFRPILAHIGDAQALGDGVSTYVGHLRLVKRALEAASSTNTRPLVLLDELGSGTDPAQGAALAQATLEQLVLDGAVVVATTHHSPLKAVAMEHPQFEIAAMARDTETGLPTFKCEYGIAGESRALLAAVKERLPPALIDRAELLLGDERRELEALSRGLKKKLEEAEQREEAAAVGLAESLKAQQNAEAAVEAARRSIAEKEADLANEYSQKLREMMETDDTSRKKILVEESAAASSQASSLRASSRGLEPVESVDTLKAAQRVVVLKEGPWLGRTGTVVQIAKKNAIVQIEGVDSGLVAPLRLKAQDLALATDEAPPPRRPAPSKPVLAGISKRVAATLGDIKVTARAPQEAQENLMRTSANTLDVRGSTLEDAELDLERFLESMKTRGKRTVYVLHGHGTGVLKKGLRTYLKGPGRKMAKQSAPAASGDGGDAFTVISL